MKNYRQEITDLNGNLTNAAEFNTMAELNKWVNSQKAEPFPFGYKSLDDCIIKSPINQKTKAEKEKKEKNRFSEYPSIEAFIAAYVKKESGDPSPMSQFVAAYIAVDAKYPKE